MIELYYKYESRPDEARQMGWSKRHLCLSVFTVGKWRTMGYWTEKQIASGKWKAEVIERLQTNGGCPKDVTPSLVLHGDYARRDW